MRMRPEETEQQRSNETKALRRFVGGSLLASLLLHGLVLLGQADRRWSVDTPEPTEVTIVPPEPEPIVSPSPEPPPPDVPDPLPAAPVPELSAQTESDQSLPLPEATTAPEGRPDVAANESPLVGSGLAEGIGGFSEGIGLNRSESSIRGSGGGARRGISGGDPGVVPPSSATPPPEPTPAEPPEDNSGRWAVCRRCPPPAYPRTALQSGAEGRVRVTVDVDGRGRVTDVRLANSSGHAELDRAVLETVQARWRFEAIAGGASNVPVEVYMTVNGSELNRQAEAWGNQTAVEVPTTGFAPAASPDSAVSTSDRQPETPSEIPQPAAPEISAGSAAQAVPMSESSLAAAPDPAPAPLPTQDLPVPTTVPAVIPSAVPAENMPTASSDSLDIMPIETTPIEATPIEEPATAAPQLEVESVWEPSAQMLETAGPSLEPILESSGESPATPLSESSANHL